LCIGHAFSAFFGILFHNQIPDDVAAALGWVKRDSKPKAAEKPKETVGPSDGALQILGILQRDARLVDFLMENIAPYTDEQIGAAVRGVHEQSRQTLERYLTLAPVVDGVEGTYAKITSKDPAAVKLLGNVPADGKAAGGCARLRMLEMRSDNSRAADKLLAAQRRYHDGRVFLRHTQRIAVDVFVHDQITHHHHTHAIELTDVLFQMRNPETMKVRVVSRPTEAMEHFSLTGRVLFGYMLPGKGLPCVTVVPQKTVKARLLEDWH